MGNVDRKHCLRPCLSLCMQGSYFASAPQRRLRLSSEASEWWWWCWYVDEGAKGWNITYWHTETRTHIRIEEKQLKQDMCMTSMCFRFTLSDVPCRAVIDGLVDSILLSLYTYFTYLPHSFRLYILTTPPSPVSIVFYTLWAPWRRAASGTVLSNLGMYKYTASVWMTMVFTCYLCLGLLYNVLYGNRYERKMKNLYYAYTRREVGETLCVLCLHIRCVSYRD